MKRTLLLLPLFCLLATGPLQAQQPETPEPDTSEIISGPAEHTEAITAEATASTQEAAAMEQRPGLFRRIINYYMRTKVDRTFEKKIDWSIAPGPNYSSDVGLGMGFLLAGLYRLDRTDSITQPSNISIYGNVTTKKFVLLRVSGDNIFNHNKQRLSYGGAIVYFPGAFYGIGHKAGEAGYVQSLTTTMAILRASYCSAVAGKLYLGVAAGFDYTGAKYRDSEITQTLEDIRDGITERPDDTIGELYDLWQEGRYDPNRQDPFSNYIARTGDRPNAFNTHIGVFAQYDTRDVTFNASKGIFAKFEAKLYPGFLGNTRRTFARFSLTFDYYQKLWKGMIMAYDLYVDATAGTPSWHMYSKLGGMDRMRGYYEGRYRDKRLVETQIELRQKIYGRHGIAGWIGAGQVWGTHQFDWENTLYSFGCGYRFEFKKGMNIRIDYGWGVYGNMNLPWDRKRSSAFLFTASEAF